MTHKLFIITSLAALLFSGCAQNAPEIPAGSNVSGADAISGDTVSINENNYGNENNENIVDTNGNYNSSRDGFKSIYFDNGM